MSNKNKGKKQVASNSKKSVAKTDDFDDSILDEFINNNASNEQITATPVVNISNTPVVKAPIAEVKATEEDEDEEDNEDDNNPTSKKDKKKKKKKNKKDEPGETKQTTSAPPISAAGKAILLRKQQQEAEELRIKALKEAEEKRIKEEEEAEAARLKAIQDEKDRKKKAKQDKIASQKEKGTYMTKSEKEKHRRMLERLENMKAAGLKPLVESNIKKDDVTVNDDEIDKEEDEDVADGDDNNDNNDTKEDLVTLPTVEEPIVEEEDDDDWETVADKIDTIKLNTPINSNLVNDEEEDLLNIENKKEQERLRELGLERKRREEELRIKREIEERERQEADRQIREAAMRKEISKNKRIEREAFAKSNRTPDNLRAAISCIMGHVDTGKTKLLDKIRNTNVQEGEAGGITQQIGATSFSKETLILQTQSVQEKNPFEVKIPGLLVIDTPGHESFANLRNRGSSLCDIAILVIDLMHGLEPQTIESINMLVRKKAPFIVALNKVDRLYNWKKLPDGPIREALALQDYNCISEFNDRTSRIIVQLNELGLNAKLYWENDSLEDTVSICPTSAHSGEGVPDLLMNIITFSQSRLIEKLMFMDYVQCTVLEVKVMEGLGSSLDVILLHGTIREGDRIVVSTLDGPITTQIRALLTPPPNREMRVKSEYIHHQAVTGTIGVKIITSTDLTRTVAGTAIMVIHNDDDEEELKEEIQSDLNSVTKLATSSKGVTVHASTLGALEALLQFLQKECKPPIPVSTVNIGTIFKKDIIRTNLMNEKGFPEFATILAFDVKIDSEAEDYAKESNVRIFTADIIYHLFDQFSVFMNGIIEQRKQEALTKAVYPCVLKIFPQHIFNKKDPIVMGVEVIDGTLKIHTPLYIPQLGLDIGRVVSIENNHKEVNQAKKGTSVSIKISCESNPNLMYGRQFDHTHALYSKISRDSINALKEFFKDDVSKEDWLLIVKLKKVFGITDSSSAKKKTPTDRSKNGSSNNASANSVVSNDALPGYSGVDDDDDDD